MIRTFIALQLEDSLRSRLSELGRSIPDARPVPPEQIHLTLRFLGDIDGTLFQDIKEGLTGVVAPPLTMSLCGVGHFPPRGAPRVIWAGVEPAAALTGLRSGINRVLTRIGIPAEERRYHPHVTFARLKGSPIGRIADFLAGNSLLLSPPCTIESFTLFSSTLTAKGAIHRIEADYPLRRPPTEP
ncbi:MAG: RNA 2',3'-cyclic phosphodiesterase [Desulfofustis sp.]|nr:RNA 2',3'-cyclic phosphodiesterase [Desulfofustis sp.]